MKNLLLLLRKELRLTLHPTAPLFLGLSALLIIPNYPYLVTFFYTTLAVFFTCLNGRENRDVVYTMLLPVAKGDVVNSRMLLVCLLEGLQLLCCIPFAILRQKLIADPNAVGMDANIALFGFALVMLGLFNLVFFGIYYRDVQKVGAAFAWASGVEFLFICLTEGSAHILPFVRDVLDTPDPLYLPQKLAMLLACVLVYMALTAFAWRRALKHFSAQDL